MRPGLVGFHGTVRVSRETVSMYVVAAQSATSGWSIVSYVVGAIGVGFAGLREWYDRVERRRSRPVVIVHEAQRRTVKDRKWVASVYLTNESAATAFNIRFGITVGDSELPWKDQATDSDASRLNVLAAGARFPEGSGAVEIVMPDAIVFSMGGDPDAHRRYWARYSSPAGEQWYASTPVAPAEDVVVRRIRSQRWARWRNGRRTSRQTKAGLSRIAAVNNDLRAQLLEHLTTNQQTVDTAHREVDTQDAIQSGTAGAVESDES